MPDNPDTEPTREVRPPADDPAERNMAAWRALGADLEAGDAEADDGADEEWAAALTAWSDSERQPRRPGALKGRIHIADDFDDLPEGCGVGVPRRTPVRLLADDEDERAREVRPPAGPLVQAAGGEPAKLAEALDEFLAEWEAEHGALTDEELAAAGVRFGLKARST